jgi:negative regulator of sigma E activity
MTKPAAHEHDERILDLLDGTLPEDQQAELRAWLDASPEHWDRFAELSFIHGQIANQLHNARSADDVRLEALQAPPIDEPLPPIHIDAQALTKRKYAAALSYVIEHTFTRSRLIKGGIAAALLLATVLGIVLIGGPEPSPQVVEGPQRSVVLPQAKAIVATLTAEHDASWAERALARGSDLRAGDRLTLTAGLAEITTNQGAVAILEAPAIIELMDNDNALRLIAGKLTGLCLTESSKGFVVKTSRGDITDLGTEFGIETTPQALTTTVFVGEVELATRSAEPVPITTRQTARVVPNGRDQQVILIDQVTEGFVRRMPREAVVASASINAKNLLVEVVPQACFEGAEVYSDRNYQLAGIKGEPLPDALIGADLVRLPAEAKDRNLITGKGLSVELQLNEPGQIYLLIPPNAKPADWLQREYQKTEMRLNLVNHHANCVVWQRKDIATGTVRAGGPLLDRSRGMYTMIVAPAKSTDREELE